MTDRLSDKQMQQFTDWVDTQANTIVGIGFQIQDIAQLIRDELKTRSEIEVPPEEKIITLVREQPTESDEASSDTENG